MTHDELIEIVGILAVRLERLENTLTTVMQWLVGEHKEWDDQLLHEWMTTRIELIKTRDGEKKAHRYMNREMKRQATNISNLIEYAEQRKTEGATLELGTE